MSRRWEWPATSDSAPLGDFIRVANVGLRALSVFLVETVTSLTAVRTWLTTRGSSATPNPNVSQAVVQLVSAATTITGFQSPAPGVQFIIVVAQTAGTVLVNSATLKLIGGANATMGNGEARLFTAVSEAAGVTTWREVGAFSLVLPGTLNVTGAAVVQSLATSGAVTVDVSGGTAAVELKGGSGGGSNIAQVSFTRSGSAEAARIEAQRVGANDAGDLIFYTKPSGGALTERVRISATGTTAVQALAIAAKATLGLNGFFVADAGTGFRINNAADTATNLTVSDAGAGTFRGGLTVSAGNTILQGMTATSLAGPLTGNASTATALQTARNINGVSFSGLADITVTAAANGGNASTATALQTPRAINGVNFDGTAAITVTAAAGTLSGATLAAGVTASSLTSVGTLANLTVGSGGVVISKVLSATVVWDIASIGAGGVAETDVTVTGAVAGDVAIASQTRTLPGYNTIIKATVTAADTVKLTFENNTTSAFDPVSETYRVIVFRV